ncbi:hypothetical protein B0F90DRAFT_1754520 [Multifurca ochricompacta]|uniref:Oxysterol-binding protein n=1 Tax=Multifurca ochricompacta TaxID=376703 RepID=A0AAD4QKP5_9AGAM|nr:hypothetical protein B0F90DRAFT_1754520 [Multifurca ochricompacta]
MASHKAEDHILTTVDTIEDRPTTVDPEEQDVQAKAIDVPEDTGEGDKLRMIVQLVKRSFGVKDLASMRLSLPASLLEPMPNLEYWHYLDRPDLFTTINDHEDPFERMLAVLRFTFSKDIRHLRGKPCKPYNSVLGEKFRAHWNVAPISYDPEDRTPIITTHVDPLPKPDISHSETGSIIASKGSLKYSRVGAIGSLLSMKGWSSPSVDRPSSTVIESNLSAQRSNLSLASTRTGESASASTSSPPTSMSTTGGTLRVAYLTEQISHHPPISAYVASCPTRHITLSGIDQISVRVLPSASVRVSSGAMNKGLFVTLDGGPGVGERYQITHPVAHVNGLLRGSFYATVHESTIVTCTGGPGVGDGDMLRAIIEYKEESWLGKPHFAVEGVVHRYKPGSHEHEEWTKVKHVPPARVEAHFEGSWRTVVRWRLAESSSSSSEQLATGGGKGKRASSSSSSSLSSSAVNTEWTTLIDLTPLRAVPKSVRPISRQLPSESRRLWDSVTSRLLRKEFSEATRAKQVIEQRQRDEAAERKRRGVEFVSRYFEKDIQSGVPTLTQAGREALEEELKYEDEDEGEKGDAGDGNDQTPAPAS